MASDARAIVGRCVVLWGSGMACPRIRGAALCFSHWDWPWSARPFSPLTAAMPGLLGCVARPVDEPFPTQSPFTAPMSFSGAVPQVCSVPPPDPPPSDRWDVEVFVFYSGWHDLACP